MTVLLTSEDVERLARAHGAAQTCGDCIAFASKGWEGGFKGEVQQVSY